MKYFLTYTYTYFIDYVEQQRTAVIVTANPTTIMSESAFEQHKAEQRSQRRYGHKTHKKKYKDYLRYAAPTTKTEVTATERAAISDNIGIAMDNLQVINATTVTIANNNNINRAESYGSSNHERRQWQRAEKSRAEKSRGFPAPPIFVITANQDGNMAVLTKRNSNVSSHQTQSTKPFYEGQINYYLETKTDDDENNKENNFGGLGNGDDDTDNSWYRRVSPMLRNGAKMSNNQQQVEPESEAVLATTNQMRSHAYYHHGLEKQQRTHQHQHHQRNHHKYHQHVKHQQQPKELRKHDQHKQHHHQHQHQHQHQHHYSHALHHRHDQHRQQQLADNSYNKNMYGSTSTTTSNPYTQPPIPPPNYKHTVPTLGHQITELEEFERYYAKWPHLARVQFQLYDEHYREAHADNGDNDYDTEYPEYDYESAAELEEAQNSNAEDSNLPPYIKKYNRRNQQLLNLLEGTLPPPKSFTWSSGSVLQPGPQESSRTAAIVRIDDDYLKEKRKRYHNRLHNNQHQNDLFAQQRPDASTIPTLQSDQAAEQKQQQQQRNGTTAFKVLASNNRLPDEDVNVSAEQEGSLANSPKEIETASQLHVNDEMTGNNVQMSWQIEKLATPATDKLTSTSTRPTPKSAVFRLPSYGGNYGSYTPRQRSRSAQFAPSVEHRRRGHSFLDSMELSSYGLEQPNYHNENIASTTTTVIETTTNEPTSLPTQRTTTPRPRPTLPTPPPRSINSFVYHRVVDTSAPRQVGAGGNVAGRKQQLPFVAITDRRLETFKKSLLERQKEFEQNNFPPLP